MRRSEKLRKPDDGPVYLTEDGLARLTEKLARLKRALPDRIAETQRTASFGDRSDNAEYRSAKSILRRTQWQILSIEDQLKRAVPIVEGPDASGKVRIGSTVILEVDSAEKTFQLVGPHETDPSKNRISHLSPLGAALIGRAKGESVMIHPAGGARAYRIVDIR